MFFCPNCNNVFDIIKTSSHVGGNKNENNNENIQDQDGGKNENKDKDNENKNENNEVGIIENLIKRID